MKWQKVVYIIRFFIQILNETNDYKIQVWRKKSLGKMTFWPWNDSSLPYLSPIKKSCSLFRFYHYVVLSSIILYTASMAFKKHNGNKARWYPEGNFAWQKQLPPIVTPPSIPVLISNLKAGILHIESGIKLANYSCFACMPLFY